MELKEAVKDMKAVTGLTDRQMKKGKEKMLQDQQKT